RGGVPPPVVVHPALRRRQHHVGRDQRSPATGAVAATLRRAGEKRSSVKVKCFGGDALIDAATADAIVDAFVTHARERHTWSTPEEALRNYARNVAEAPERLTGSTERLPEIGAIAVHPVSDDRVGDWLRFFDHDGFAGNPDWAACYCLEPHVP